MPKLKVVLDTNVVVAAVRSRNGASFRLLSLLGEGLYTPCVSVPLAFEHEDALKREAKDLPLGEQDVDDLLDYLCSVAERRSVLFLWRPALKDRKNNFILELAVESGSQYFVTFNTRGFEGCELSLRGVVGARSAIRQAEPGRQTLSVGYTATQPPPLVLRLRTCSSSTILSWH